LVEGQDDTPRADPDVLGVHRQRRAKHERIRKEPANGVEVSFRNLASFEAAVVGEAGPASKTSLYLSSR
jgi:hypothetical protein